MPFLRLTRDQRGYEYTFLLHAPQPGDRPRVLYWYRSAPGVRVGRTALDEDAIRTIEERHPDIEFDWPQILEEGNAMPPEVEPPVERPRRKPQRQREAVTDEPAAPSPFGPPAQVGVTAPAPRVADQTAARASPTSRDLLEELVGREISTRLRRRYQELVARMQAMTDETLRARWQARADALDPDTWRSPEQILHGVERADTAFDELKREMA